MKILVAFIVALFVFNFQEIQAKKKKKTTKPPQDDSKMFDSKTLKCLVCKNVVEEFEAAIWKVDPKKMIDTGTFRVDGQGVQKRSVVPYARSQVHLLELTENICKNFEDYAQAKWKKNGKPTIIRLTTPQGNMNPDFGKVDIVPDDDLNTRLKFHCEGIVEDMDEQFLTLFAEEQELSTLKKTICVEEGEYCKNIKDEL